MLVKLIKCYVMVKILVLLILNTYDTIIFHNKLEMVSCYWFKFELITKITFLPHH